MLDTELAGQLLGFLAARVSHASRSTGKFLNGHRPGTRGVTGPVLRGHARPPSSHGRIPGSAPGNWPASNRFLNLCLFVFSDSISAGLRHRCDGSHGAGAIAR